MAAHRRFRTLNIIGRTVLLIAMALSASGAAAEGGTVTIGTSQTGLLIWLAKANGYFADEQLPIEILEVASGVVAAERVQSGELTFGTSSEFAFTSQVMDQSGICVYGTISASRTTRLIARSDRVGPDPRELAGKKIAVTPNGIGQYFLSQFLVLSGLDESQVTLVPAGPEAIIDGLTTGSVDAAMTWEPHVSTIRSALGALALDYPDQAEQYFYFVLHGRCDLSAAHAAALRSILRAIKRAEQFIEQDPTGAKTLIAKALQISEDSLAEIWPQHSLTLTLTQDLLTTIESEATWRIEHRLSRGPIPDTLDVVRTGPLRAVDPQSVRILE